MTESGGTASGGTESGAVLLGNRYELGGILGRGGMADVRIGRDLRLGRTVAIKQLRPDLASDESFQARFRREAQSAAALNHPSIVAVYDTGEATDVHGNHIPYIVMEYVDGQTLRDVLRDGRKILPERALSIVADVLSALDYSHRQGIIHRDIKPANVMLTPDGQVKVMDFGIARAVADASVTQTAAVIGTAQYLSPEQARGETVDARSDIYSTGCLLYELLAGRPPFIGESPVSVAYQHVREEARPPSQFNPDVSGNVDHIVAKALAKRTDERYQSAADMRADIDRVLAGHAVAAPLEPRAASATTVAAIDALSGLSGSANTTQVTQAVPGGPPTTAGGPPVPASASARRPVKKDNKRVFWALAALALVLLGVAAWALLGNNSPDVAKVAVPDVTGQSFEAASSELTGANFKVDKTEQSDDNVPKGDVISQDPTGGSLMPAGTTVNLTVSTGKETITMPRLAGYSYKDAKKILEDQGLQVEKSEQDNSAPQDEVINSNPPEGSEVEKGSTVTLLVSKGEVTVPDVVGKSVSDAINILENAKFKVSLNGPSDGTVTDQSPNADKDKPQGTTVTITSEKPKPSPSPTPSPTDDNNSGGNNSGDNTGGDTNGGGLLGVD